ncbi:collagen alpha-1(III) chain-like [Chiloscyllium plagiosum]|uniref:collagen alpha-1(III) chain-like n=1 Tax=Chiloscyllium plagiosum TaxID=36176 RepID=UPI001CB85204|nr:collagen alpha-1(III) chain-like [Chiloscyllium plagiosum]
MVWSHQHSQECGFIPNLKSIASGRLDDSDSPTVLWSCAGGHSYTWEMLPPRRGAEAGGAGPGEGRAGRPTPRGAAGRTRRRVLSSLPPDGKRSHPGPREGSPSQQEAAPVVGETAKERDMPAGSGSTPPTTPQGAEGPAVPAPPALPRGSPERPSEGQGIQAEPDRGAPSPPGSGTGTGTTTTTPPGRTRRARRKTGQPAAPTPTGNADLLQLVCESDSEEQPVNTARDTGEQLQQQEGSQESEMQVAETELLLTR